MVQQCVGQFGFSFVPGLPVIVEPKNVQVSSDAGILPIKQFDDQIGLTERPTTMTWPASPPSRGSRTPSTSLLCGGFTTSFSTTSSVRSIHRPAESPSSLTPRTIRVTANSN